MQSFFSRISARVLLGVCSTLFGLSSIAHAGTWSAPSYVPAPGKGGLPMGSGGNSIIGTAEATFTWQPASATDVAPTEVMVLETATAGWNLRARNTIVERGMQSTSPSFSSTIFRPSRRPRIVQIQVQQIGDGAANNGLGSPYIVEPDGQRGHSSGTRYRVLPVANGQAKTGIISLSASGNTSGGRQYNTLWQYKAEIVTIKITRNNVDVTAPKPETPVIVGERNEMNVSVSALPTGVVPTFQWTIPGDRIKNFVTTGSVAAHTPFTGHAIQLTTTDLQSQSPSFYWHNGTFAGDPKEVSVVVTIAGTPITVKAKFKIYRPSFDGLTATYHTQPPPRQADPLVDFDGFDSVSFTPLSPGVKFQGVATVPNVPTAVGQIGLQQLSTFNVKVKNEVATPHTYKQIVGISTIDTIVDGQVFATPTDTKRSITPNIDNGVALTEGNDAPNVPSDQWTKIIADFSFTMYLIYKPTTTGSIWVPLGKVDWGWGFNADDTNFNHNWVFTNRYPTAAGSAGPSEDTHDFPEWNSRSQDAQSVPIAPW